MIGDMNNMYIKYLQFTTAQQKTLSKIDNTLFSINFSVFFILGAVSLRKTVLPGMGIPMLKIRRPNSRLIFNMEIAIRR